MDNTDNITRVESGGNSEKPNPNSSALGLGQFVKATWLEMIRRYRPDLAQGKSEAEILELRKNPVYSREMTDKYEKENEAKLSRAGLPVTPGSTYLLHFAGPSGGIALMKADPNTPVESILSDQAVKANPYLQGKTASWVIDWANKKMAAAAAANEKIAAAAAKKSSAWLQPTPQPIPYLAQTQALDPTFGATSWPPRPASPNVLPPDTVRSFAGAPRVAPVPSPDETIRAQQALDNLLPAPGAPPWVVSDRFGGWDNVGGVSGPTRSGGSDGLSPFTTQDPSLSDASGDASVPQPSATSAVPTRRVSTMFPKAGTLDQNLPASKPQSTGGRPAASLPTPSVFDQSAAPIPYMPVPTQDAPAGILGRLMQIGAFDPSDPDQPPAGGLLALLQQYMRTNPDGGATR